MKKDYWWNRAIIYQIYLQSFYDSDEDGIGDIKGVISKLSYLQNLGITCIWLTPFYPSPKVDNGYDVSDYYAVAKEFGTLDDFKLLVQTAHDFGIKVIIDMVINHTSTDHPWFHDSNKEDWYIWTKTPNNWESFFGGSAWEYDESKGKYYYHSFAIQQADLNWQNTELKEEIFRVLDFWMNLGVDGFRFDVINNLTINSNFKNNPYDENGNQIHKYDVNQEGIQLILREIHNRLKRKNPEIFLVGEISSDDLITISRYNQEDLLDTTFNFNLSSIADFSVPTILQILKEMSQEYSDGRKATFLLNSHDMSRSFNRLVKGNVDLYLQLACLIILNNGISVLFQGEELGLWDFEAKSLEEIRDIQAINKFQMTNSIIEAQKVNRDKSRAMLPWNNSDKTSYWIASAPKNDKEEIIFAFYKDLIRIRQYEFMDFTTYEVFSDRDNVLKVKLSDLLIILNFSEIAIEIENNNCLLSRHFEGNVLKKGGIWIGKNNKI